MSEEKLTPAQGILLRYCHQRGMTGIELTGKGEVRATSREGEKLRLTINVYGDIMNADTKRSSRTAIRAMTSATSMSSLISG